MKESGLKQVVKDDDIKFTGTDDECRVWILQHQGQSMAYALKHGGYTINPMSDVKRKENKMSKSSILDTTVKRYLLDAVESEDVTLTTTKDKIEFIRSRFMTEKNYEIKQSGRLLAMISWFQGLGFPGHIAFYNYDILQLAQQWGSLPANPTESQEDKILNNYWNLLANKTLQLFNGYRIPK